MIIDKVAWAGYREANRDDGTRTFRGYGGTCIRVAGRVMSLLDRHDGPIDASQLVTDANRLLGCGITGFMAVCVAQMVIKCHHRGEAFRRSWNKETQIADEGEKANASGGVLNPACLVLRDKG